MNNIPKPTLLLLFLFFNNFLYAQMEFFVEVNSKKGTFSKINKLPEVYIIQIGPRCQTFDENNQIYFFKGQDRSGAWRLYSIEAATGKILHNPLMPLTNKDNQQGINDDNLIELQYDNNTKKLYGLHWKASIKTEFLVSIDPSNGSYKLIDSIPGVYLINTPGYTIFNEKDQLFIFNGIDRSGNSYLYSVDVTTGKVVSKPSFKGLYYLKFNNITRKIIGLYWDDAKKITSIVEINGATGNKKIVSNIPDVISFSGIPNFNTINENKNYLIFRGAGKKTEYLYTIDIATGNIIDTIIMPKLCNTWDNLIEFHYSNKANKLFALHWTSEYRNNLNDTIVCPNSTLKLNVSSSTKWSNGETGQFIHPKKSGMYSYVMKVGCEDFFDTIKIDFFAVQNPYLGPDLKLCLSKGKYIKDIKNGTFKSKIWNTSETEDSIIGKPGNSYILYTSDKNGCTSSDTIKIISSNELKFSLGKDRIICVNDSISINIPIEGASYSWNDGNTDSFRWIKSKGTYIVRVNSGSCERKDTINIGSASQISADFSANDVCENDTVKFTNNSSHYDSIEYLWKFGDGQKSNSESPMHLYKINGISTTYNITMYRLINAKCSDSITKAVNINSNPESDFSLTFSPGLVNFKALQKDVKEYRWDFGNGDSAVVANPLYSYSYKKFPSTYNVCLTTVNAANCYSKTCKNIFLSSSIDNTSNSYCFNIYPNPSLGNFTVSVSDFYGELSMEIYNDVGQIIYKSSIDQITKTFNVNLAPALYTVKFCDGQRNFIHKIVIRQ